MIDQVHNILKKEVMDYDVPVIELLEVQTQDPFKILVGTILSARTQDKTTMAACKRLFAKAQDLNHLDRLSEKQIATLIYPVGFYKTKAKHLKQIPKILNEKFNRRIPETIEELMLLPGVGRKTANLVRAVAFRKPAICVDTHVHRIMNRLGYVKTKTPFETEMELRKKLPRKYWLTINTILVAYGQNTCRPVNPKCDKCPVTRYCGYYQRQE